MPIRLTPLPASAKVIRAQLKNRIPDGLLNYLIFLSQKSSQIAEVKLK